MAITNIEIIQNPYQTAPLTALAKIKMQVEGTVTVKVHGKVRKGFLEGIFRRN
jgi:hypothetical protein